MRRAFKTFIIILLLISCLSSCGEYVGAVNDPDRTLEADETTDKAPDGNTPDAESIRFSVTLTINNLPFIPETPVTVRWTDGFSYHEAPVDAEGKASIIGLDGEFRVTLSDLPDTYTYNPNVYTATNDEPHVEIKIFKVRKTRGNGADLYNCIDLSSTGVYESVLLSEEHVILYQFVPTEAGVYSVESWVDTTANEINPKLDVYGGSSAYKYFRYTLDEGGESAQYTKNFRYEVTVLKDQVGQAFTFGVKVTSKRGEYPVNVQFIVSFDGDPQDNRKTVPIVIPEETFKRTPEYDPNKYIFVGAETLVKGHYIFDGTMYGLNEEDGYYHVYNAATGKYDGPILYAHITSPCRFLDDAFTRIEDRGNKALTVTWGPENDRQFGNYKLFIQGYAALIVDPPALEVGPYFCVSDCPCYMATDPDKRCPGSCPEGCTKCDPDCRHLDDEYVGQPGYANYVNSDGVYAVTPELKEFLQRFSTSQLLFFDGNGWVENNDTVDVDAMEDDQWLFACGYYVEK